MKSIIEYIQDEDPSYDPLTQALAKLKIDREDWKAANNRIYADGYFGPINQEEWEEQNPGWKSFTVKTAQEFVAKVLEEIGDYHEAGETPGDYFPVAASEIRAALVPYYKEIYGVGYPQ